MKETITTQYRLFHSFRVVFYLYGWEYNDSIKVIMKNNFQKLSYVEDLRQLPTFSWKHGNFIRAWLSITNLIEDFRHLRLQRIKYDEIGKVQNCFGEFTETRDYVLKRNQ